MSALDETFAKREEQLRRVTGALAHKSWEEALAIVLTWMSIDEVERMLETLEQPQ